jgi:hypothetical protein
MINGSLLHLDLLCFGFGQFDTMVAGKNNRRDRAPCSRPARSTSQVPSLRAKLASINLSLQVNFAFCPHVAVPVMPPTRGAKRSLEESDANPTTAPTPRAKRQTTLSFARTRPDVSIQQPEESNVQETNDPDTKAPVRPAAKKAVPAKAPKPDKVLNDTLKAVTKTWNTLHKGYKTSSVVNS